MTTKGINTSFPSAKESSGDALRWVGDLDHPIYSDERQRFVWYEASAIGFQILFLGAYFVGGAMVLIGGAAALPYAVAALFPVLAGGQAMQSFAKRNGVEYWPGKADFTRSRGRLNVAALLFLLAGFIRAVLDSANTEGGLLEGNGLPMVTGMLSGALAAIVATFVKGRKARSKEEAAALSEI